MAEEASAGKKFEVTATRRRPRTFDELAGQDFVAATLKNSIETGHIAHAYLFSGPRGCGKTSAARILARSLNCEKGPTAAPCGVCSSCLEISRGASLDIIEIDGASNTSVNDVRQIKDEVLFPPNSGRYKIYIIDEVHMLSNSAFNALLKTIEEPPPYIVFIFATTELHKVPATIKSRCQQFNFRLIPVETIRAILQDTCREMQIQAEDEALFWIAKESTGSLRDAYTLFDQVVSFSEGTIRAELIREKLGLVGLDKLNALAEACAANDAAASLAIIDAVLEAGIAVEQFIVDLAGYYRNLLLIKSGVLRESLLGYSPDRFSAKPLEKLDAPRLEQALSLLLDLYRNVRHSFSPRFELENAVSKLCWLDRWVSPAELKAAVTEAREILDREGGAGRPLAVPEPADNPPVPADARDSGAPAGSSRSAGAGSETVPPEPGSAAFRQEVIARLRQERGILASALDGSLSWEWNGDKLVIPVRDAFKAQLLQKDGALIGRVLAALAGKAPAFEVVHRNTGEEFLPVPFPAHAGEGPELSPQAERVRRIFQGTVVKNPGSKDEHKPL
ncbi:MAG: DNA polymerase III subunit gamma/tau [Treponema sp.]|jgi:DNA polymerase-3 subunit gamma/tau|nr:DNA polymerase III subunit gamma/tau [Treponema sp.]